MNRTLACTIVLLASMPLRSAVAGYSDTLPAGAFLLDERLSIATTTTLWNDAGEQSALLEPVEQYEPGGGLQGKIIPRPKARYTALVNMLAYGITDQLTGFVALPIILDSVVEPNLGWEPGDYNARLGRAYSEADFWAWAQSMGQPKPGDWSGNHGTVGDLLLGARWRFSDLVPGLADLGLHSAAFGFVALPTGSPPDPEELTSVGTSSWNLHTVGELGLHVAVDKTFRTEPFDRVGLGIDFFYEALLPHSYVAPTGEVHPLLLNQRPYVGDRYTIDPGDFLGAEANITLTVIRGPDGPFGAGSPPIFSASFKYNFTYVGQSDWTSESALWDWEQEKLWKPGYKNILIGRVDVSLLRFGVPVQAYAGFRTLSVLAGKNVRAPDSYFFGLQVPMKFW